MEAASAAQLDTLVTHYKLDESIFPNPERGFYIYSNLLKLDSAIGNRRDEGYTLIWGRIQMKAYRDVPSLPQSFLAAVDSGFTIALDQGMKVIVRGSYGSRGPGGDYTSYQDPPRRHIENHIEQLAPLFAAHADVIALFEAGFVGPWGEWHTTELAQDYDLGREMLFHILDHTPTNRLVPVRNPYLKQQIFNHSGGFAIVDAGNAYSGERVARVGHHNAALSPRRTISAPTGRARRHRQKKWLIWRVRPSIPHSAGRPASRMPSTIAGGRLPNWKPSKAAISIAATIAGCSINGPCKDVSTRCNGGWARGWS